MTQSESSQKISQQKRIKKIPRDFAVLAIRFLNETPGLNAEPLYDLTKENVRKIEELIEVPFASFDGATSRR